MTKVLRTSFFLTVCFFLYNAVVLSQEETVQYSILTTSNTDGSHELLAKKAEAFQQFKTQQSIAMSFGSILGPTRIVENDNGLEFLRAAHRAGIDYIIPAKGEFMFGAASFKILVEFSGVPEFISANILDEKSRKTLLKPYFVWDVSGLRLCVIGFSDMNIIKDSPDEAVEGIDIISFDEALDSISDDVKRLRADIVIAAGAIGRDAIMAMARKYPFIDTFITNNRSGGFADTKGVTSTVFIADKPVYITSEEGDHIGHVIAKYVEGMESRELTDTVLGDMFPPEKVISAYINRIIDELKRKDFEETVTVKGGKEVAGILREIYGVDVVFLERQSLYYYPLEDSLTLLDMRRLIKPSPKVTAFSLKGERLKLILEKSKGKPVRALRLHYSGITEDAKVDSIPIQDDREYTVLTTEFLRNGGNGYELFRLGVDERRSKDSILEIVESYLVSKDIRLRKAAEKKLWALDLHFKVGSNVNKIDIDSNKAKYGDRVPKPFRGYNDQFVGYLRLESWKNTFTYANKSNLYQSQLDMKYVRSGNKLEKGKTIYKEEDDDLIYYNKYTYNHPKFILKPYIDTTLNSELYSGKGTHPINLAVSAGLTRKFSEMLNLVVNVGFSADRNYLTSVNGMGFSSKINFGINYPKNKFLTKDISFNSEIRMQYKPLERYDNEFALQNRNDFTIQIWRRFDLTIHINSYMYRNSKINKLATGMVYDFTLNYSMDWKL